MKAHPIWDGLPVFDRLKTERAGATGYLFARIFANAIAPLEDSRLVQASSLLRRFEEQVSDRIVLGREAAIEKTIDHHR